MTTLHTYEGEEVTTTLVAEYLSGSRGDLETAIDALGVSTLYSQDGAVSFTADSGFGILLQVYSHEGDVIGRARLSVSLSDVTEVQQS